MFIVRYIKLSMHSRMIDLSLVQNNRADTSDSINQMSEILSPQYRCLLFHFIVSISQTSEWSHFTTQYNDV